MIPKIIPKIKETQELDNYPTGINKIIRQLKIKLIWIKLFGNLLSVYVQ